MSPVGSLEGQVCVVTGASRGIGRAITQAFASAGAHVVLVARDGDRLREAALAIGGNGSVSWEAIDLLDPEQIQRGFESILATHPRVDVLVNNAGVGYVHPSDTLALENWTRVVDSNLRSVFLCAQAVVPAMLERGSGSIINMSSMTANVGQPLRAPYVASKAGIAGLTRALAVEWGPRGVRVNAIAPGYIRTDLTDGLIERGVLDARAIEARTPLRRFGQPSDVAAVAVFLASAASSFVTGQVLVVDGGWTANGYFQ